MSKQTPATSGGLTKVEKANVRIVEKWHSVPALSSLSSFLARHMARAEFELILHNVVQDHHFERLEKVSYEHGVLVCGNHRSYLDPFAIAIRSMHHMPKGTRFIAPPRTEGLFDKPWGIFLNFILTGMNMYPPVVRASRGSMWGKQVIQILTDILLRGKAAIFIHPEGGRNKGSDPYQLNHAKPGLGKIIHSTKAVVFPVFLQGFPNKPGGFVRGQLRRGAPLVHAVMGEPIDFSAERAQPASPEIYRAIGQKLMEAIRVASVEEREIRARIAAKSGAAAEDQVVSEGSTAGV
jgi:1-acyl-sn-glycerol-3-phosphate acyltransferase